MESISDAELEMLLNVGSLEKEQENQYIRLSRMSMACDSLIESGFVIVSNPCDECMFFVRGGILPQFKET